MEAPRRLSGEIRLLPHLLPYCSFNLCTCPYSFLFSLLLSLPSPFSLSPPFLPPSSSCFSLSSSCSSSCSSSSRLHVKFQEEQEIILSPEIRLTETFDGDCQTPYASGPPLLSFPCYLRATVFSNEVPKMLVPLIGWKDSEEEESPSFRCVSTAELT